MRTMSTPALVSGLAFSLLDGYFLGLGVSHCKNILGTSDGDFRLVAAVWPCLGRVLRNQEAGENKP